MRIKVSLPKPDNTNGIEIKKFLRQMELAIHHLQKGVEQMEKDGDLNEDTYIIYRFPFFNSCEQEDDHYLVHVDEESDHMQEIEVEISN